MTLEKLLKELKSFPGDTPLVFLTEEEEIGSGYHITEFKHAQITGIDCGANLSSWTQSCVQLLDGQGGEHMKVGKFAGILEYSIAQVAGLGSAQAHIEYAPENIGMRNYKIELPELIQNRISIMLREDKAVCKPALNFQAQQAAGQTGCCGQQTQSQTGCCT